MSALQWALLIVGAVAVIAVYVISRRSNRLPNDWEPPSARAGGARPVVVKPGSDQMDMFAQGSRGGEFDEFGVGKPRKRNEPGLFGEAEAEEAAPGAPAAAPVEEKIVTLLIAEREGTAIFGPKIHLALQAQGLVYGDHRIYHRQQGGKTVFSVASLVKPGLLDPAEQKDFSTPGLTVFMLLPGPAKPAAALQDMISTAQALAAALNAQVFDASRQPLTPDNARTLKADVGAWAQRNGV